MASAITCKDIFEAVYLNAKGSFLDKYDTVNVKSKTVAQTVSEDENLNKTTVSDTSTQTEINTRDVTDSVTETVKESIERVSEDEVTSDMRADMEEKFPFIISSACRNLSTLDKMYREAKNGGIQPAFSSFYMELDEDFPLLERFAHSCVMFACSMLTIDVDEKRSDAFYEKYIDEIRQIASEIPFDIGETVEKYPY